MSAEIPAESDARILSLFDNPGEIETPTPGVKVWLAGDVASDNTTRPVMIKRVRETTGMGQRKARATEALHLLHPNILRPRRWLADGGYLYVMRDVVRGKNLRQALTTATGERPGPELLRKLLLPLMDALTYVHGQGVVHGGISPENILIADDGRLLLVDFATVDPNAPRHQGTYAGKVTVPGDVRALGEVLAAYLPNTGAFMNIAVRGRIEGVIRRCDTVEDLKEILNSLEKLVAVPTASGNMSRPKDGVPAPFVLEVLTELPTIGIPPLAIPGQQSPGAISQPGDSLGNTSGVGEDLSTTSTETAESLAPLTVTVVERGTHVPQGGGGIVTLHVRNEGPQPLVLRMISTQHAWLNVRPVALPLIIPVNGAENIEFSVSAARLTPGEYRSEVYLSVNKAGAFEESTNKGWDKHTSEVRIIVEPNSPPLTLNSQATAQGANLQGTPPFPEKAPKISGGTGCAIVPLLLFALPACLFPLAVQLFLLCRLP